MKSLALKFKLAVLRSRLARVTRAIEEVEHYQQHHAQNLERLLNAAGNLRADIWYAQNPRPPVGTTLKSLNAPIRVKGILRRLAAERSCE